MNKRLYDDIFKIVSEIITRNDQQAYVIGGYVRDVYLNRPSKDIDIMIVGSGIELAEKVAKKIKKTNKITQFKNFGTAMLQYKGMEIEFVGARKESYRKSSRKPIVETGTLEDDQKRRDFTINTMALSLHEKDFGQLIDPFNGLEDIKNKIIRTPLDPGTTFSDDPLRMMRAIRFATQLNFKIEGTTFKAIKENKDRISIVSAERISDEFNKILLSPKPSIGMNLLEESGLLQIIFPEINALKGIDVVNGKKHKDNFYHTIKVLDNISKKTPDLWLRYSALLHDIAKPAVKKFQPQQGWTFHGHEHLGPKMIPGIFKRLRLPLNEKMKFVQKMVALHHRPMILSKDDVTGSAVRRLVYEAGDDIESLMTLCEADITSKNPELKKQYLANFKLVRKKIIEIEEKDAVRNFQPPISGNDIMEIFNIPPGKEIGIIKNAIKEAILDGIIKNDYQEAYDFMLQKGKELGLKPKNG